jgi:hypothetical protein
MAIKAKGKISDQGAGKNAKTDMYYTQKRLFLGRFTI